MGKLTRRLPSPAMIVAIIAVVLAVGGTAVAALSKKDKKQVRNIADSEITKKASGLAVKSADSAKNADALGGIGPGGFTQGAGHNYFGAKTGANPSNGNALLSIPGIGSVTFDCAANGIDSTIHINNNSGSFLVDVGQNTDATSTTLNPLGPNIGNGASATISRTGANHTVGITTLQLGNDQNGKVASIIVSNVFCSYTASASTNQ